MNDGVFPEPDCHHFSPSVDGKSPFTGRMRFHQSWYRRMVLDLDPGPHPRARGALYGNMLTVEDGLEGKNFLTAEIFRCATDRYPDKPQRLLRNMLSSEPMCFNLFGPLKTGKFGTRLLRLLPGFPPDATVTGTSFEHEPRPKESHLNDRTAFDALIRYKRANGRNGFLGVETKLTEPFSPTSYAFKENYARWMKPGIHRRALWWRPGAEVDFPDASYNQLWRNHLLAYAMLNQDVPEYTEGYCVVVYPERDAECGIAIEQYRKHLTPGGHETLLDWTLESIAEKWASTLEWDADPHQRHWLDAFQTRYLRLDRSEEAWQRFQGSLT